MRWNGRNSGDVAIRFASRRSRVNPWSAVRDGAELVGEARERIAADLEHVGVAVALDARGARLRGQQRHLAEHRALAELRELGLAAEAIGREDAQRTAGDEKERVAGLALADRERADRESPQHERAEQAAKRGLGDRRQQRDRMHRLGELAVRVGRVLGACELRGKRAVDRRRADVGIVDRQRRAGGATRVATLPSSSDSLP